LLRLRDLRERGAYEDSRTWREHSGGIDSGWRRFLGSIFCADELRRRPWRAPDYATENRALGALNNALDVVDEETLERFWGVLKKGGKLVTVASTIEGNVEQRVRDAFINRNKLTERKHYG
jgi:NADPH:quinone reductase-like Zn-dependent oxidoreductase